MSMLSAFALHCPCKRKIGTPRENFDTPKENSITPRVMALSLVNSLRPKGTNKKARHIRLGFLLTLVTRGMV